MQTKRHAAAFFTAAKDFQAVLQLEEDDRSFRDLMSLAAQRRRRSNITRRALQLPSSFPFNFLINSRCDRSLITVTGFHFRGFEYVLRKFKPVFDRYNPYSEDGHIKILPLQSVNRGRPRTISADHALGLVLAWGRTRGTTRILCVLFGITAGVCSVFLRFGLRILLRVLSNDAKARIEMPTVSEVRRFQSAFASKYPFLREVYAVADGLKLHLQQSGNSTIQNIFYNGWTHDHYVSNGFVFSPDGAINACAINAPGSMHDSMIAEWGGVYRNLDELFDSCGGRCVVDSAFCKKSYPFLIKSSQDYFSNSEGAEAILLGQQATSAGQAAE